MFTYRFWKLIGEYDAEGTTYTALAGTAQTSPYTPDFTGRLIGLKAIMNRSAATSLINHVQFRLTNIHFLPNEIHCGCSGSGLQTAPALQPSENEWICNQPVVANNPITIEARNVTADTPVSVAVELYGLFEITK